MDNDLLNNEHESTVGTWTKYPNKEDQITGLEVWIRDKRDLLIQANELRDYEYKPSYHKGGKQRPKPTIQW